MSASYLELHFEIDGEERFRKLILDSTFVTSRPINYYSIIWTVIIFSHIVHGAVVPARDRIEIYGEERFKKKF
jgi:hypothetical protein